MSLNDIPDNAVIFMSGYVSYSDRKFHALGHNGHEPFHRFCDDGDGYAGRVEGITAGVGCWCKKCLRKYAAWRKRYASAGADLLDADYLKLLQVRFATLAEGYGYDAAYIPDLGNHDGTYSIDAAVILSDSPTAEDYLFSWTQLAQLAAEMELNIWEDAEKKKGKKKGGLSGWKPGTTSW